MSLKRLIVAIDGPAGSGKSSGAKLLARVLAVPYIDTGALYRTVTLKAMREKVPFDDVKRLVQIAKTIKIEFRDVGARHAVPLPTQKIFMDGRDVSKAIRTPELTNNVFYVAREPRIRRVMVKKQRELGRRSGAVMEGRDIGTKVFPDADFKFFLVASPRVRARRRYKELIAAGKKATLAEVLKDIRIRDRHDRTRKEGPLRKAKDAYRLDTSSLTIQEQVDRILDVIHRADRV